MKLKLLLIPILCFLLSNLSSAQEVTIFPGFWGFKYYQDDERISKKQMTTLMLQNKESKELWKKSKNHAWVSLGATVAQTGILALMFSRDNDANGLAGVIGFGALGLGTSLSVNRLRREAVLAYNEGLEKVSSN